jgi:hypothetical protein
MNKINMVEIVEKYQCPGCVNGNDTKCGEFEKKREGFSCENHVAGTISNFGRKIYLGMPKGFDIVGTISEKGNNIYIRDSADVKNYFDPFNVPVWVIEDDGNLLVRTFVPRLNVSIINIFPGCKISDIVFSFKGNDIGEIDSQGTTYTPIDVSLFQKEID